MILVEEQREGGEVGGGEVTGAGGHVAATHCRALQATRGPE